MIRKQESIAERRAPGSLYVDIESVGTVEPSSRSSRRRAAAPSAYAARADDAPRRPRARRAGRWVTVWLAVAAVGGGVYTVFAGPFQYDCTVEFLIAGGKNDKNKLGGYRRELMDCVLATQRQEESASSWNVVTRADRGTIRHSFTTISVADGRDTLGALVDAYLDRLRRVSEQSLTTPGEGERILEEQLDRLQAQAETLRATAPATSGQPVDDPFAQRRVIVEALDQQRGGYASLRATLDSLSRRLATLRQNPVPQTVRIDPDVRRAALEADVTLVQDLRTLEVRRAEMRARLLEVSDAAAPALDALLAAAGDVVHVGSGAAVQTATGPHRLAAERFVEAGRAYEAVLAGFAARWNRDVDLVKANAAALDVRGMIESQARLARQLGDMLFDTVEPLSQIKEQVDAMAAEPNQAARHHELISVATRRFHRLRTAHHQFEFIASDIKAINNPRLDAALQGLKGLHRRAEQRTQAIEQKLHSETRDLAVKQREEQMADLVTEIEALRPRADAQVDELLATQDQLNGTAARVDGYLEHKFSTEERARRLEQINADIQTIQNRLDVMAASRTAPVDPTAVTVVDRYVDRTPVNLTQRLAAGWLVTATALVAILVVQGLRHRG